MRCIRFLVALLFKLLSVVQVGGAPLTSAAGELAASLGIIQPGDIEIHRLFRGRPLSQTFAVYTLYLAQLKLYRRTVYNYGDAEQPPINIGMVGALRLEIRPIARNHMTLGSSFYGVYQILRTILHPEDPADGCFESKWRISNRALAPGRELTMGYLNLLLGVTEIFRNASSISLSLAPLLAASLDTASPTSNGLLDPFPIPQTGLTLQVISRGTRLTQVEVLLSLNALMSTAWQNVASNHRSLPVHARTWNSPLSERISVMLRPQMEGRVPQMDDTDLAEAAFGLVYYYLLSPRSYETTVKISRPNEGGESISIGEIEIIRGQPRLSIAGSGNGTLGW